MPTRPVLQRRLVVIGAARNCGTYLPRVLSNLAALVALYDDVRFVFAVSDSTDETLPSLERWVRRDTGRVLQLGTLEPTLPLRTMRIAAARNACMEEVRASYADYDHLLVTDLDDVLARPIPADAFRKAAEWLDASAERAAVFPNSLPRYYDTWALRHETWCPVDCWHPIWERDATESYEAAKIREVLLRQVAIPTSLPPIPVQSAFGGFGLYKLAAALRGTYHALDERGRPTCEHVSFNLSITRAGGKLFIVPALVVQASAEHLYRPAEFRRRWRIRMLGHHLAERLWPRWPAYIGRPANASENPLAGSGMY
jgi:hypothetical protein